MNEVVVRLEHPEAIDPARTYRLRVVRPPRVHGGAPVREEIEIPGHMLLEWLFGPNHDPATVVGETVRAPVLDVLGARGGSQLSAVWADLNELRHLLDDGFVLLDPATATVMNMGRYSGSPLAGRVWSAWYNAEVQAKAAKAPVVGSEESVPEAPPVRRRSSPWKLPAEGKS